jgi:hypothetical protein
MSLTTLLGYLLIAAAAVLLVLIGVGQTFGHYGPGRIEAWALAAGFVGVGALLWPGYTRTPRV